nr:hypothetical protein [uncultured Desulfobacter sp.]
MFKQKISTYWMILTCLGAWAIFFAPGCAGKKTAPVLSLWPAGAITTDGHDADWPETPPLYHDTESRLSIRAMNNNQTLYVAASVGSQSVQASIVRSGVSLSLIPEQDSEHPFTIQVKGKGRSQKPGPNREKKVSKPDGLGKRPEFVMADTLTITYPHGSNPMDMNLEEAQKAGLTIALKKNAGRMVIEAAIRFDAISSLDEFAPDRRVALVLASGQSHKNKSSDNRNSGMRGGGGRMGGGGGKDMKKTTSAFEARLNLILANGPA